MMRERQSPTKEAVEERLENSLENPTILGENISVHENNGLVTVELDNEDKGLLNQLKRILDNGEFEKDVDASLLSEKKAVMVTYSSNSLSL